MVIFEGVEMLLQEGDIITSKKGILLVNSPINNKDYIVYKMQYNGIGKWEILSEKYEVISKRKKNGTK